MIKRLDSIKVGDNNRFKYNYDVLNSCFGQNHSEGTWGQKPTFPVGDGCEAWFPKERVLASDGTWRPGSTEVNWKNYIVSGGHTIISYLNDKEFAKPSSTKLDPVMPDPPFYSFMKSQNGDYKYVGTFLIDLNASSPRFLVYRRLRTSIELSFWKNPHAYDYLDDHKKDNTRNESALFKDFWLRKNYKEHSGVVNEFRKLYDPIFEQEYKNAVFYALRKASAVSNQVNIVSDIFGAEEMRCIFSRNDITMLEECIEKNSSDILMSEIWHIAQLANDASDMIKSVNRNKYIRNSLFGASLAGKILASFSEDFFIYSLDEDFVDQLLKGLKADYDTESDLVEKWCILYFWKQCNSELKDLSPFGFIQLLKFAFGIKESKGENVSSVAHPAVDADILKKAMKWFMAHVVENQSDSNVDFHAGYIWKSEGYKYMLREKAQEILESDSWTEDMIGSHIILDAVISAINIKENNIVDYRNVDLFSEKANDNVEEAERILYDLYRSNDPKHAFEKACVFWARRFDLLSYLLFIDNNVEHLPVKPSFYKETFEKLRISTEVFSSCTWENYQAVMEIIEEIRIALEEYMGMSVSPIDAQSFVWMLRTAPEGFDLDDQTEIPEELLGEMIPFESTVIRTEGEKEGRVVEHYVTKYERSAANREKAIKIHGLNCAVCGFNFEQTYGEQGTGFIEVHHVKPLYSLNEEVTIDPATDLVCLCANCHRMIHHTRGKVISVAELKSIVLRQQNSLR